MTEPLAIVGDIHGDSVRLLSMLKWIDRLSSDRIVIFVGDYINRGANSRGVIEALVALKRRRQRCVFLLGNHEVALLSYLSGSLPFFEFAGLGGLPTARSYLPRAVKDVRNELLDAIPEPHVQFIRDCDLAFENDDVLVSHCGMNPSRRDDRSLATMVMTRHEQLFSPEARPYSKVLVCGHYLQSSGSPYTDGTLWCIDTGCGTTGGPLTALLLPERSVHQT